MLGEVTYSARYTPWGDTLDTYGTGNFSFGYTYDASGNVLQLQQNLGPGTVTTVYAYDAANQLNTAQQGSTSWQYTYDANGSLISDGMKTYTYDSANRLIEVSDQSTVTSLSYNGLGQRLSMDAAGVIAHYVMDGDRPLTAESAGNTTFYLYGLGSIAEKTDAWSYSLPDGTNTPRQLSDVSGEITLSARYTPWGDTLDTYGTGGFTFGYFGGVMDAATGLLYVGDGQYYDPSTGRFLTRNVNPNSTNPYVPWNPIGSIVGPLGLIALVFGRRKKGSRAGTFLVLLLVVGSVGMTLAGCGSAPPAGQFTATATATPGAPVNYTATFDNGLTVTGTLPASTETPIPSATYACTLTSTPTPFPDLEPWKHDEGYDPGRNAILNWGALATDENSRRIRAHKVWEWMGSVPGWWNNYTSGYPKARDLAAWILVGEGSGLLNSQTIAANPNGSWEKGVHVMVGLMGEHFNDGIITDVELSTYTFFFNPEWDSVFDPLCL